MIAIVVDSEPKIGKRIAEVECEKGEKMHQRFEGLETIDHQSDPTMVTKRGFIPDIPRPRPSQIAQEWMSADLTGLKGVDQEIQVGRHWR